MCHNYFGQGFRHIRVVSEGYQRELILKTAPESWRRIAPGRELAVAPVSLRRAPLCWLAPVAPPVLVLAPVAPAVVVLAPVVVVLAPLCPLCVSNAAAAAGSLRRFSGRCPRPDRQRQTS